MNIKDNCSEYTSDIVDDIKLRIFTYKKIIDEINKILNYSSTIDNIKNEDNLIAIAPYINIEYKTLNQEKAEHNFMYVLEKYEEWLNVICFCVITNQKDISFNKKLKQHWISNCDICLTIYKPILVFFKQK